MSFRKLLFWLHLACLLVWTGFALALRRLAARRGRLARLAARTGAGFADSER